MTTFNDILSPDSNSVLLQLSIAVPLFVSVFLMFADKLSETGIKRLAFAGFATPLAIALWLCFNYDSTLLYNYTSNLNTGLSDFGISLKLGLNGIGMPLFLLAGIVGFAAGIFAIQSGADRLRIYLILLLIMHGGLMGVFASVDIFFFYFFHELALIPTFIMIGIWGGQGRRSIAMEMTIYLTVGAMLTLIGLIALYVKAGVQTFDFVYLSNYLAANAGSLSELAQQNIFGLLLIGFGILVSLWPFHTWAPRGYAAAPTSAAMLHAGVLKKFGLYGLIQIAAPLLPSGLEHWTTLLIFLALGNVVIIGLVTMAESDLKLMIGYSSVMHMGYCFLGLAAFPELIGVGGAVMLMFAHGLSVALLFLLATTIYRRTGTYDMRRMGGLGKKAPILAALFVAATMANIGLPGFANFWGELSVFVGVFRAHEWVVIPAVAGIVISAIYGLRAVARIFYGEPTEKFRPVLDGDIQDIQLGERLPALVLIVALLTVGLVPSLITDPLNTYLTADYNNGIPLTQEITPDIAHNESAQTSSTHLP